MSYTREQIKERANGLIRSLDIGDQIPVPIEQVATRLGYGYENFLPDESTRNVAGAVSHSQKMIYLNDEDSARRQLFTLAHELGHIVLHFDPTNPDQNFVDYRTPGPKNTREKEADMFAAELLMPEQHFINSWAHWSGIASLVAADFAVSEYAAEVRARVLGLM
ncbi:ImmA/IrrE family metallo-endopeptidase [Endozoicomonas montiporae]|uniref:IrrE N-terminal-like domain-containing protein n=1 Tax=Endozoicomonas montiporae CL-33 TaxID=570277 RepID=A0A142BA33_9GAMM|nr:ImmA/IrrE family metallo-endopeptidase [Endozoicomonas montiporae]AMO55609.1 hypothetical protein EZMO1_1438 [Endozoicomonas montiporae CL-33]AMO58094.1 hypothetical protein EZMO1_4170 [Endozoicomonas montiporae CL-33]